MTNKREPQAVKLADLSGVKLKNLRDILDRAIANHANKCSDCPEPIELIIKLAEIEDEIESRN